VLVQAFYRRRASNASPASKAIERGAELSSVPTRDSAFARLSFLHRFGQPLPNLLFPVVVTRVRAQYLRRPRSTSLLHARPELHCSFWSVAALRHHQETNVIGFSFVLAGGGHGEEEVEEHFARVKGDIEER